MSKVLNSNFSKNKTEVLENRFCSKVNYQLTTTEKEIDDTGNIRVYGISVSTSEHTFQREDISANACVVISLLKILEEYKCSPLHLYDVIDDFLDDLI